MHLSFRVFIFFLTATLCSCSRNNETIKIKGSDTEVNLAAELAEDFHEANPVYTVSVSGGGSGLGIASLLNKQADIANSSRPLSEEEKRLFDEKGIQLKTIIFAEDATAIIVNQALEINEINVATLADIFSGKIDNWNDLNGPDLRINLYGRQSNSGTHSFIQQKLNIKFSRKAKEMNGNAQIIEGVKIDRSGIGYVGAGYVMENSASQGIKTLRIKASENMEAISPTDEAAIKKGAYFFQRPLYQFIPLESWEKAKEFIEYEKSEAGRTIIRKSGYYLLDSI